MGSGPRLSWVSAAESPTTGCSAGPSVPTPECPHDLAEKACPEWAVTVFVGLPFTWGSGATDERCSQCGDP